jgi:hypothetical protein
MLPKEKRKPVDDISREIIFAYGIPKVGKSTFFSKFPDALFISTEEGLGHLEVFEATVTKWLDFLLIISDLEKNPGDFKTVVIDTADNLFMYCQDFVFSKHNITHESDMEFGKGYSLIEREFRTQITRLSHLRANGIGLVMISHSMEKESRRKGKDPETKITHTLPTKARKVIAGMADLILYMEVDEKGNRVIRTKPDADFEAGDRTGRLPSTIPLDYEAFIAAYYGTNGHREELIGAIEKGLAYLAEKKIDSFDIPKRVAESMTKHLGIANIKHETVTLGQLQAYLQHLRAKGKATNGNGEKKDV